MVKALKDHDMEIARAKQVPLEADSVASPEVYYDEDGAVVIFAIHDPFWLDDDVVSETNVGRITFEGLDSIRVCGGEHMPYKNEWKPDRDGSYSRYPWVWEIEKSTWLQQRHSYAKDHYNASLLDEYVHYLFRFHDEYIELISKGIWFDKVPYDNRNEAPKEHPRSDLEEHLPTEEFEVEGIKCLVRTNPLPTEEIVERSKLCSQKLFQYYITLDGKTTSSDAANVRTYRERGPVTRHELFYPKRGIVEGVCEESQLRPAFEAYVAKIAQRRRDMGKS